MPGIGVRSGLCRHRRDEQLRGDRRRANVYTAMPLFPGMAAVYAVVQPIDLVARTSPVSFGRDLGLAEWESSDWVTDRDGRMSQSEV